MSEFWSYHAKEVAEAVAPYGTAQSQGPHTKLSISLPADLVELIRRVASESGLTVSATIGGALRRTLAELEQERLDRALELDAEDNLAWAEAIVPVTSKLWDTLEW